MEKKKTCSFAKFMKDECIQQKAFAKKIGISEPALRTYMNGKRLPPMEVAMLIEKATHGNFTLYDWFKQSKE